MLLAIITSVTIILHLSQVDDAIKLSEKFLTGATHGFSSIGDRFLNRMIQAGSFLINFCIFSA